MTEWQEARAALERGGRLIVVTPPAVEHAEVVWALAPRPPARTVVVCADPAAAAEWAAAAPADRRVHAVTGLARTTQLLAAGAPEFLAGAAKDLAALVAASALKLDTAETIVVAWPEGLVGESGALLDSLLAEAPDARRVVLTWDPARLDDFMGRHAHRAPLFGAPPRDDEGRPAAPVGPARFVVAAPERRPAAARDVLDALRARNALTWRRATALPPGPLEAVVCLDLPNRDEFAALGRLGPTVLLLSATQLPYARSIAAPLEALPLGPADRALDRAEALRAAVERTLAARPLDGELALLAPLFERHDPAEVAAALLALAPPAAEPADPAPERGAGRAWERLFVNVGKRDRASAKDLVGALIREAGLTKEEIGKIDVRDGHSVCELAAGTLERAAARLSGATIRGRRVSARRDRP